jgi:hypothetical protein
MSLMSANVLAFALGCSAAVLMFVRFDVWCSVLPPIVGGLSLAARVAERAGRGVVG